MDNSPLNAAHQQHRRAEASMRFRRYDEAIQCHERAVDYLQEALKLTESIKAIESLTLQCEYHKKQKELAIFKKEQFENYKRNLEKQKLKMAKRNQPEIKDVCSASLHTAINKTLDEADSIVEILYRRNNKLDSDSSGEHDYVDLGVVHCHNISNELLVSGLKEPKSDHTVIEELQIVNQQLRKFINQLLTQLEESAQETKTLQGKVASLESERDMLLGIQHDSSSQESPQNTLETSVEVITESAVEDASQFIFSPRIELGPGQSEDRELPPLPPLEMPDFDYESVIGQMKIKSDISQELDSKLRKK